MYRSIKWGFGGCRVSFTKTFLKSHDYKGKFKTLHALTERCCTEEVENLLSCEVSHLYADQQGWADNYLEIQGHQYCNDFIGYMAIRKVTIQGKKRF